MPIMNKPRYMDEEGFSLLRAAVVAQACEEFLSGDPRHCRSITRWIRSEDFMFFSDLDPEALIERLYYLKNHGLSISTNELLFAR